MSVKREAKLTVKARVSDLIAVVGATRVLSRHWKITAREQARMRGAAERVWKAAGFKGPILNPPGPRRSKDFS